MDDAIGHLHIYVKTTIFVLTTLECGVQGAEHKQSPVYRFPVTRVSACPQDSIAWKLASKRRNCTEDESSRNRYICVPNEKKTHLLEFCYDQIRPRVQEGNCLELRGKGILNQIKCHRFKDGCPQISYFADEIFTYPACLNIDIELRCFIADPECKPPPRMTNWDESQENTIINLTHHVTSDMTSSIILVIVIGFFIVYFAHRMWRRLKKGQVNTQETTVLLEDVQEPKSDTIQHAKRCTPLLISAANDGNLNLVRSLLKEDSNVNICDEYKQTALHLAALSGHLQIVKELIDNGAEVDVEDQDKNTPLLFAARQKYFEIVQELMNHGANVNASKNSKKTPLYCAAKRGYYSIVEYILQQGADVNYCTAKNRSPLFRAAKRNHYDIVLCLTNHGADVNIRDFEKESALSHAVQKGHVEIAQELRNKGAIFDD